MRALTILELLENKALEKVDVIAHSESGMNVTIASSMNADKFRHFIFVGLPGVTDEQSYFNIIKRGAQNAAYSKSEMKSADEEIKERYEQSNADIKSWMRERGGLKGMIESMNPGRVDISTEVRALRESGHGVSIVSGVDDKMLPMSEYQRNKDDIPRSADELGVDGFYSIKKGHSELEVNGEVGYLSIQALDALVRKYSSQDTLTTSEL